MTKTVILAASLSLRWIVVGVRARLLGCLVDEGAGEKARAARGREFDKLEMHSEKARS